MFVGRPSPMPKESTPNNNSQLSTFQDDELGSLPEGWEERVHTDGRIFYIDHSKEMSYSIRSFFHISVVCIRLLNSFQTPEPLSGRIQDYQIQKLLAQ